MSKRKKRQSSGTLTELSPLEEVLLARGFTCHARKTFNRQVLKSDQDNNCLPRFTYTNGRFRVLTDNSQCPFFTVQRMSYGTAAWFVDFPIDVHESSILAFIDAS